ncbi:LAME_0G06326g1_1 [Lachancea meyersii CBS 8951]|uniref:peptidyl-tRNA hydrolase n=1 Tax=Lachancea meyersii CBS 8951 TaxID=1266667 RepID=A0A1G4K7I4_9SACH|nr:LAME_0G06326g1_1 [Lachancea meyersii CBS 8951]
MNILTIKRKVIRSAGFLRASRSLSVCITGIGNPEPQFAFSRHNAGLLMLDLLKSQLLSSDKPYLPCNANRKVQRCQLGEVMLLRVDGDYINLSGKSVVPLWNKLGTGIQHIVVHDELSLAVGKVQLRKPGTSVRGHNGLKDITKHFGGDFYRLAVGIGRPEQRDPDVVAKYVLSKFPRNEIGVIETESVHSAMHHLKKLLKNDITIPKRP